MHRKIVALCFLFLSAVLLDAQQKPNVIFIFADDLGWGDLACYGHPYAKTPAIDELASEGIRFGRFYVTGVTCCPSRTGIMTSRHPASYPKYMAQHGFAGNTTLTELFNNNGYTTGHFGKWHIGPKSSEKDGTYGIDEVEVTGSNHSSAGGRDADLFAKAINFIEANKDRPFYVNIWGHITHYPVDPVISLVDNFSKVDVKRTDFGEHMQKQFDDSEMLGGDIEQSMRNYLGDVYGLDIQVGLLMKKLDELGLAENTIVVFSSDHGPAPVIIPSHEAQGKYKIVGDNTGVIPSQNMLGYAGGLRGHKHTFFEGGVRSPLIVRWPGKIPSNRVDKTSIVSGLDFIPTLCTMVGISYDKNKFEGVNMADAWQGKGQQRSTSLFWRPSSKNGSVSMLKGDWKLHEDGGKYLLYDLSMDEKETEDVAEKYPEILDKMITEVESWVSTLPDSYVKSK